MTVPGFVRPTRKHRILVDSETRQRVMRQRTALGGSHKLAMAAGIGVMHIQAIAEGGHEVMPDTMAKIRAALDRLEAGA